MAITVSMANLFLYCYFGKMATDSYLKMTKSLYESNWIDHPVQLQKYLILMIGNMQRPLYYHGFGIAKLNLETYTTVSHFIRTNAKYSN